MNDNFDKAIISIPVGHREAVEVFRNPLAPAEPEYTAYYMAWDATGGISADKELASGDAETVMVAAIEAVREKREADRKMEAAMTRKGWFIVRTDMADHPLAKIGGAYRNLDDVQRGWVGVDEWNEDRLAIVLRALDDDEDYFTFPESEER